MSKFRKKSVEIEAEQFDGNNGDSIKSWSGGLCVQSPVLEPTQGNPSGSYLQVQTPSGFIQTAGVGIWIIKNRFGHVSTCKPDIFEKTYEAVEE